MVHTIFIINMCTLLLFCFVLFCFVFSSPSVSPKVVCVSVSVSVSGCGCDERECPVHICIMHNCVRWAYIYWFDKDKRTRTFFGFIFLQSNRSWRRFNKINKQVFFFQQKEWKKYSMWWKWGSNPRPFGIGPEPTALDRSAIPPQVMVTYLSNQFCYLFEQK